MNRSMSSASFMPLSDEQMFKVAPSIFANNAHESRSSRYAHIPTVEVVNRLRENGFMPVKVVQSRVLASSDVTRKEFTKHMIRFRHTDYANTQLSVGQVFPEVVMVNSHDGSSSYQLSAGLFRLVCANGMVCGQGELDNVRVKHTGNVISDVIDGSYRILDDSKKALFVAEQWGQKLLTETQQAALAVGAHHVRFADADGTINTPIQPAQLLRARRSDDMKNDLWTTFNRIQENVIKGGLHGIDRDPNGRPRRVSTREVKGIDGSVNLNKALWKMAEHLAANV
jgi:hypothetical protein